MRILHVADYHFPDLGYEITYLVREQKQLGHEVSVVTSDVGWLGRMPAGVREEEGIPVHRLRAMHFRTRLWLWRLHNAIDRLTPDVIHCHSVFDLTAIRVALLKRRARAALVYDCHAADFNTDARSTLTRRTAYYIFRTTLGHAIRKRVNAWYAISEEEQQFLCRELSLDIDRVPIIRLGVDVNAFRPDPEARARRREQLGIGEREILCIHTGQLAKRKEIDVLIDAVGKLRVAGQPMKLLLVGDIEPAYLTRLRSQAGDGGAWFDHLPRVDKRCLAELLSAADIAAWPGDWSIGANEAMAASLPLVLADTPRSRAMLGENSGMVVRRKDTQDLVQVLLHLTSDEGFRRESGKRTRKKAESELSCQSICRQTLQLYDAART